MSADIRNAADWWKAVDAEWPHLLTLIADWHPARPAQSHQLPITAPAAERACKGVREDIRREAGVEDMSLLPSDVGVLVDAERYRLERNPELYSIFSATWFGVPESRSVHGWRGFSTLCDLCSESWALNPADPANDGVILPGAL